jgi:hypothetical protein
VNIVEVQEWIDGIKKLDESGDYEAAHASEDALLQEFVRFVSHLDNEYSIERSVAEEIIEFLDNNDGLRFCA